MTRLSRFGRALALGPAAWTRIAHTAIVSRRIERSLRSEQLDATAERFGSTLSFEPPAAVSDAVSFDEKELFELRIALALLKEKQFNGTCLRRALVMSDVLRARRPLLRVGVAKDAGVVTAHAWLEIDGLAIDPMADREYLHLQGVNSK
jgi:hypothetical protein